MFLIVFFDYQNLQITCYLDLSKYKNKELKPLIFDGFLEF